MNKLELVITEQNLAPETAQSLLTSYRSFFDQAHELVEQAKAVKVTDATQVTEIKESRRLRLELARVRVGADKLRKSMKEESLRKGKAIDGAFNILRYMVEPIEEALHEQELFAERAEAERKEKLGNERHAKLSEFGWISSPGFSLAAMKDADFDALLEGTKARFEQQKEAERKAEEERIAKEKAEREEQERIRAENARLKAEAEEKEKALAEERARVAAEKKAAEEKAEAERKRAEKERQEAENAAIREREAIEAKARAERQEIERKAAEEKAKLEAIAKAEKEKADALAAKVKAEAEAKQKEERLAREKAERELQIVRETEARKKKEAEAAAVKAANAPDCDKLLAFKDAVANIVPVLSKASRTDMLSKQVAILFSWIDSRIEGMR